MSAGAASSPAIEFRAVTKRFGSVLANDAVSFAVERGFIHGVVGENGAGKSTIMKILYGLYQPDSGEIHVEGRLREIPSPEAAISLGIGMVHQHFMLVPTLTVWQNVILGREPSLAKLDETSIRNRMDTLQREFGFGLDLGAIIENLTVGQQQQVEILKLLYREARVLILDEPTAVLTPQEVDALFARLQQLRQQGKTIVLITHKLREILSFTQHVTVMRGGKVIETRPTASLTAASLAEAIVGRKTVHLPARRQQQERRPVLEVRDVSLHRQEQGATSLESLSFTVHAGEIVGIAGVEGNGQRELIEVLAHTERDYGGEIRLDGQSYRELQTYAIKQQGLAVIPPDRHHEAVVLDFSVQDNLLLGHHREERFTDGWRFNQSKIAPAVESIMTQFDVRPRNPQLPIKALSGGNQQKAVVGRELSGTVSFLLAAHPTRGVDIGAIELIHARCLALRDAGAAILLVSSELEEILALADRILVLYEGRIQGEMAAHGADEARLGRWMTGGAA